MSYRIELAVERDVPRIRELMVLSRELLPDPDWFVDDDEAYLLRHIRLEGYILKYMQDDRCSGYLMVHKPGFDKSNLGAHLHLPLREYPSVTHMESTCVDPVCRGQGIFRILMHAAVEKERMDPATKYLMGTVHPQNVYSKRIFLEEGFHILETTLKYGGKIRDIMVLQLRD